MKVIIGSDIVGVDLKAAIIKHIESKGIECEDMGGLHDDSVSYPEIAERVCRRIIESGYKDNGVLICGTGIGMCMTANKFPGIFAAVGHDCYSAERMKLSNNGNVLCMGERVIGVELAKKVIDEWLSRNYVRNERSQPKVDIMHSIDQRYRKGV